MGEFVTVARKPVFILAIILALIVEFVILEGVVGISLPSDRGSVVSSYEIREKEQNCTSLPGTSDSVLLIYLVNTGVPAKRSFCASRS
jgi:hypothetical protein